MSRILQRMSSTTNDPDGYLALNNEFHLTLYRASGRSRLCTAIQDMMNALLSYMRMQVSLPPAEMGTHEGHGAILDAAVAHDGERCAELTEAHLRLGAGVILRMSPDALGPDLGARARTQGPSPTSPLPQEAAWPPGNTATPRQG